MTQPNISDKFFKKSMERIDVSGIETILPSGADMIETIRSIYRWEGDCLEIHVPDTSIEDQIKWIDFANKNYFIEWFNESTQKYENKIDFKVIEQFWNGNNNLGSTAHLFINHIQIDNSFFIDAEIENYFDPRQIDLTLDHDIIIEYMVIVSRLLNKPVILTPFNKIDTVLIRVFNDRIKYFEYNHLNQFNKC